MRIRVIVADQNALDRGGIVRLLDSQRDMEVVGEAASVDEAVEQCRALNPDVLALALHLPGASDTMALTAIRTRLPRLRILALSERGMGDCLVLNPPGRRRLPEDVQLSCEAGTDCLQLAAARGAMATLRRSADPEDLFRAVRAVAAGHAWYDPTTAGAMLAVASGNGERGAPFSSRELEVAALIAEGQSNKEIAATLGISEPTVKKHVGHILEKLGLSDRLQAGLFLARHPLIFRG